ncbi:MAG: RagB/SusD family nutrient uptake outer membrane protein [Bacteroidales bacterium]|nr:RagB/SusD family nutrient uptake outer membrane protein [Bacteroidales bacterium]
MKKLYIILIAVAGIFAFSSCDDFLDVKPTNQLEFDESIKTAADAEVFMTGVMSRLTSGNYYGRNMFIYGDAKGGDLTIYSQGRGYDYLYSFNHTPSSGSGSGFWSTGYDIILQLNNLLNNIAVMESDPANTEDFGDMKGRALTLRALLYFDLVRLYGLPYTLYNPSSSLGVPNVLEVLDASAQPDRATVSENYAQIISDLSKGAETITKTVSTSTNGYPTYWLNRALAARVYLTMGDYANALSAAEEVINSGKYELYENDEWVDSWSKQFGSESIFELHMLVNEGNLTTSSIGAMYSRIKHYSSKVGGYFGASDYWLERMAEDPDDIRWGVMSYDENSESFDDEEFAGMGDRLACCYKYFGGVDMQGDGKDDEASCNVKVIRLSEMYLIAAEAALEEGDAEAAADYLNAIMKRSPNVEPATAATVSVEMILKEKSKEFFGEGLRYFDRLRHGEEIEFNDEIMGIACPHRDKIIDTKTYYKVVLPISIDDINASPNLKNQQNPGY